MKRFSYFGIVFLFLSFTQLSAQTQNPPGYDDYGKWERLSQMGEHGGFSPDGRWLVYGINRSNGENEMRILRISDGHVDTVAFGSRPSFASDSRWIAYSIGYSEAERESLRERDKPVHNKLGLRSLTSEESTVMEGVRSFSFSPDGAYLVIERYPSESQNNRSNNDDDDVAPGNTIIIRELSSGRDMSFGNVAQFEWQETDDSHLLAMLISAENNVGNGVHLFDPATS